MQRNTAREGAASAKSVYLFGAGRTDGKAGMKELLGGKFFLVVGFRYLENKQCTLGLTDMINCFVVFPRQIGQNGDDRHPNVPLQQ